MTSEYLELCDVLVLNIFHFFIQLAVTTVYILLSDALNFSELSMFIVMSIFKGQLRETMATSLWQSFEKHLELFIT